MILVRSSSIALLVLCLCSSSAMAQSGGGEKSTSAKKPTSDKRTAKSRPKNVSSKPIMKSPAKPPNPPAGLGSFDFITATLNSSGNLKSRNRKSAYSFEEDLGGHVKLEMVAIPPGEFMMGSSGNEAERQHNEGPQHRVRISYWLYMGKFEITQAQWRTVMGTNPSNFKNCDECPVTKVSWNDAVEFCRKLSARTGKEYRLPSESEWEYAARAGTSTPFAFGETITPEIVNYNGNSPYRTAAKGVYRGQPIAVGSLGVANGFGLYDMHGNVFEWCEDSYHNSYTKITGDAPTDGSAWSVGEREWRVLRGGSFFGKASDMRSAHRGSYVALGLQGDPFYTGVGFRVVVR
jgi:eukaryotic-like serine/threonine-protein kinase